MSFFMFDAILVAGLPVPTDCKVWLFGHRLLIACTPLTGLAFGGQNS